MDNSQPKGYNNLMCQADIKPLYHPRSHKCPTPALPGESYCQEHLALVQGIEARHIDPERIIRALKEAA